jgi:hypothetical protein
MEETMSNRIAFAVLLLGLAFRAGATDYTDMWYSPTESGWGVNVTQNGPTQFLTFFIYAQNGQPTWLVAATNDDGSGNYTRNGNLFATTGSYYGAPWAGVQGNPVGSASFQPTDTFHATLVYSLTNGPTVTKTIQRQTLGPYALTGNYSGSIAGQVTGCSNGASNIAAVRARYNLAVTQVANASATLTFTFVDTTYNGTVCTLSGPITQIGRLYQMPAATYVCVGPGFSPGEVTATIESFHQTGLGIEGRWTASTGGGCAESIRFVAVVH